MSPSAHRRSSRPDNPEQRQQALIGLTIVLAFVVIGMIIILERQRQPFTVGDVALPVHDLAKPVVTSSAPAAAHSDGRTGAAHSKPPAHPAGVAGAAAPPSTHPVTPTHPASSPVSHPSRSSHPPARHPTHHPGSPTRHPGSPTRHPGSPTHHPSSPSSPPPSHHPSRHPTHHPHPSPPNAPSPTPPSSTPPPAPSVAISQGDAVDHCWLPACDWINMTLSNFPSGSHTITCNTSRRAPYHTFDSLLSVLTRSCFMFGNDAEQVWVTVDGVQSNTITWVGDSGGGGSGGGDPGGGGSGGGGHHGGHHGPGHGHGGWGGGHHGR
jgi:hypothetical protein